MLEDSPCVGQSWSCSGDSNRHHLRKCPPPCRGNINSFWLIAVYLKGQSSLIKQNECNGQSQQYAQHRIPTNSMAMKITKIHVSNLYLSIHFSGIICFIIWLVISFVLVDRLYADWQHLANWIHTPNCHTTVQHLQDSVLHHISMVLIWSVMDLLKILSVRANVH